MNCKEILLAEKILFDQFSGYISFINYWTDSSLVADIPGHINLMVYSSFLYEEVDKNPDISINIRLNKKIHYCPVKK